MKDFCLELVQKQTTYQSKLNILREYLQAYTLRILHDLGMFRSWAFMGGTALRFLFELPRFSEDLDFVWEKEKKYNFEDLLHKLEQELTTAGYRISLTYSTEKTVQKAFIKFEGILFESGLSPLRQQKFSVKLEIDTRPPKGAVTQTYLVNKYFPIVFFSYDISTLFAGKLGALLTRSYTKGRDFYDLGWYLSHWKDLSPNLTFLNNGLQQTGWKGDKLTNENWRQQLSQVVQKTDWKKVERDVESFLQNPADMNVFTKENIINLIHPF